MNINWVSMILETYRNQLKQESTFISGLIYQFNLLDHHFIEQFAFDSNAFYFNYICLNIDTLFGKTLFKTYAFEN